MTPAKPNAEGDHDDYAKPAVHASVRPSITRRARGSSPGSSRTRATRLGYACEEFPKPVHAIEPPWKRQLHRRHETRLASRRRCHTQRTTLDDIAALIDALRLDPRRSTSSRPRRIRDFADEHTSGGPSICRCTNWTARRRHTDALALARPGSAEHSMLRTLALPDLRTALMASRVVCRVRTESVAEDLRVQYPGCDVRVAGTGVSEVQLAQQVPDPDSEGRESPVVFGLLSDGRSDVLRRARDRAGLGDRNRRADGRPLPRAGTPRSGRDCVAAMALGRRTRHRGARRHGRG